MTQIFMRRGYTLSSTSDWIRPDDCHRGMLPSSAEVHGSYDLNPLLAFCLFIDGHLVVIWSQLGLRCLMQLAAFWYFQRSKNL